MLYPSMYVLPAVILKSPVSIPKLVVLPAPVKQIHKQLTNVLSHTHVHVHHMALLEVDAYY